MRSIHPLNHQWHFSPEFREEYLEPTFSADELPEIQIPHTMTLTPFNHFDEKITQGIGTYFRDFSLGKEAVDHRIICRFYGVMNTCKVYVNGVCLGSHEGGYTPFEYDLTSVCLTDRQNRLLVIVDGAETANVPPFGGVVDYLSYSGIYREVELQILEQTHLQALYCKAADLTPWAEDSMVLSIQAPLVKAADMTDLKCTMEVLDGDVCHYKSELKLTANDTFIGSFQLKEIKRWDIDDPKQYRIRVTLLLRKICLDQIDEWFGFRSISFTSKGFYLNQRRVKLIGLDRHQSYPYVGYAMPRRMQEKDAEILRFDLGCRIVRTSHYMQSDHFIRRADEIGLLVLEEIPGWQYIGNEKFKALSLANLEAMIRHHYNHPSIVLWGVRINESPDDHDFYVEANQLAKMLDDSRPTTGIRNFRHSECLEDVYAYNDFSHIGDNAGLVHPNWIAGPKVPYLVTEHNGHIFPTKKTDPEMKQIEQALRHLKVIDAAYATNRHSGAIGWCLADYNTHKEFGSSDRVCYHGVTDMFRLPKPAAYVYASQREDVPVLEVASSNTPGEFDEIRLPEFVIFTNCDYVTIAFNGEKIGTYFPNRKRYPHLPHPPIILPDLIGNRLEASKTFSKRLTRQLLRALRAYYRDGIHMPIGEKIRIAWLMLFKGFTFDKAFHLIGRYIINWGKDLATYTIQGYRENQPVITKLIGRSGTRILKAFADDSVIAPKGTYEVTRIVIQLEDGLGNICRNAHDVINVTCENGLAVIGPNPVALVGGSIGVYLRTTGKKGRVSAIVTSGDCPPITLDFLIE
ncbi:MAG: glycoside hydrolase family 2 TIM barrel-domain containing protein [Candidatus Izemoplasmatales bacterium]|jgi:beta-galactosidase